MTEQALQTDINGLLIRENPLPAPEGPWNIVDILDYGLSAYPERIALQYREVALSWFDLESRVCSVTGWLIAMGASEGSRIAVQLSNSTVPVEIFLASQRIGAIWVGINPNLSRDETEWILQDCDAALFITQQNHKINNPNTVVIESMEDDWIEILSSCEQISNSKKEVNSHSPAAIAYTSGTSGRPKGAVHSQHNLLWPGVSSRTLYPPMENEKIGTALSLSVLNILVIGPLFSLLRGTTSVVLDPSNAEKMAKQIRDAEINDLLLVPTQAYDLVHSQSVTAEDLSSLNRVVIGASHTPQELRDQWKEKFGFSCTIGYGLSEAPSGVTRLRHDHEYVPESAGHALAPVDIEIFDEEGTHLPPDSLGEICISPRQDGPWKGVWSPMLGYWRKPKETVEALKDNRLHTGDIGLKNKDDHLIVIGRLSDVIVRGGANIHPTEIERVLLSFPVVDEAAVIGVPDQRLGEKVYAAITVNRDIDVHEISDQMTKHLARYKIPEKILIVPALPRNAMGKVDRERLRGHFL